MAKLEMDRSPSREGARRGSSLAGSPFFWLLVILSIVTLGIGLWQWQFDRRSLAQASEPAPPAQDTASAPDFLLSSVGGAEIRLSDLRGQVVLLNFWATWCPPCRAEMPDLNTLHQDFGAQHDFTVVGINLEESPEQVTAFVRQLDLAFPMLLDVDARVTAELYNIRSLPASIIIDRDGRMRDAWMGQIPKAAMLARLEKVW